MTAERSPKHPRHQYDVEVDIDAPIDDCFTAAFVKEAMMAWVPSPRDVDYDHRAAPYPYGPGAKRKVTLKSGMSLVEVVLASEQPARFVYGIPRLGYGGDALMQNYEGHMHFTALGPSRTHLTWSGYFDCPGWRRAIEPLLRAAMRQVIHRMALALGRHVESQRRQQAAHAADTTPAPR